jgi:hypothetical protein
MSKWAPSWSGTWDRVRSSLKRKASISSTGSVVSNSSICSQVSDDPNGPIYSTLQTLSDTLLQCSRSTTKDARFSRVYPLLETFVDQVAEATKTANRPATRITLTSSAHSVLVVLYDDTRLLCKEFAPDASGKRLRRLDEQAYEEISQRITSLQKRFEEWSSRYLVMPVNPHIAVDSVTDYHGLPEEFEYQLVKSYPLISHDNFYTAYPAYSMAVNNTVGNIPKPKRTMTDIYSDELYSPNYAISSAPTQNQSPISPHNDLFKRSSQAANNQNIGTERTPVSTRSSSPLSFQDSPATFSEYPFLPRLDFKMDPADSSSSNNSPPRPEGTSTDGGTYSCTYHGCPLRFETPTLLQKHKREGHRQAHSLMTSSSFNSQAGPHRCERINPSTGRPCNEVFSRPYDLTRHEDRVHNARKQKVRCDLCTDDKTFSRADALTRHYRVCHPDVEFNGKQRRFGGRE